VLFHAEAQPSPSGGTVMAAQRGAGQSFPADPAAGEEERLAVLDALLVIDEASAGRQLRPGQGDPAEHLCGEA
jgi:hypothetical protein